MQTSLRDISPKHVSMTDAGRNWEFRSVCRQTVSNPAFGLLAAPGGPKTEFCPEYR